MVGKPDLYYNTKIIYKNKMITQEGLKPLERKKERKLNERK